MAQLTFKSNVMDYGGVVTSHTRALVDMMLEGCTTLTLLLHEDSRRRHDLVLLVV